MVDVGKTVAASPMQVFLKASKRTSVSISTFPPNTYVQSVRNGWLATKKKKAPSFLDSLAKGSSQVKSECGLYMDYVLWINHHYM